MQCTTYLWQSMTNLLPSMTNPLAYIEIPMYQTLMSSPTVFIRVLFEVRQGGYRTYEQLLIYFNIIHFYLFLEHLFVYDTGMTSLMRSIKSIYSDLSLSNSILLGLEFIIFKGCVCLCTIIPSELFLQNQRSIVPPTIYIGNQIKSNKNSSVLLQQYTTLTYTSSNPFEKNITQLVFY